ncbi:lipopolysaccharide biosynthesis protein [Halobacillus sp. A5]|uniref:lipopolysaccharide biosynthesis protein n=1 Tax=Halobacillus sp. A5 TaxID=2880263 RepID=UPI0020A63A59|nr:oligosaccharide flippase family protein [Halobacillus sp. A5]MCP3029530.1 oligosaccharide flippase family protein [Halobacillus sp. A5]
MKQLVDNFLKKKFVKNVLIIATGTAMAQVVTFLLLPIVTRLYGPEAYGLMGTFLAIVTVIIPIAALSYPIAIVLPKGDDEAKIIIKLSLIITLIMTILSLIILLFSYKQIATLIQAEEISKYLFLIPLVILTAGYMQVIKQWLIRKNEFKIVSKATILQPILTNGGMIFIGLFYPIASVLIVISALKQGVTALLMHLSTKKKSGNFMKMKSKATLIKYAKKYYDFPMYRAPEVLISAVSKSMPIFFLGSLFGPSVAGFYTLCRSVLNQPIGLIGSSVGEVFYPRIAKAHKNNENLVNILTKATLALAGVGMLPFGLLVIIGPSLFEVVFGKEWVIAGEFARWLSIEFYFLLISRPSIKALPVLSAQRFHLFFTTTMLFLKAISLFCGYYFFENEIIAVAFLAIIGGLMYFSLIIFTLTICKKFNKK